MARSKAHEKLLTMLIRHKSGDVIKEKVLMEHMEWAKDTLRTYESKQMLAPFILRISPDSFKAIKDGLTITQKEIIDSFSQARPKSLVLVKGVKFIGPKGPYVLEEKLGEGAVGQVWKCENLLDKNKYAIKILYPKQDLIDSSQIENVKDRFRRESKNGKNITSDSIVKHIDHAESNGTPFLVMELAIESVQRTLENGKPFDLNGSAQIINSCLNGLEFLHSKDCFHRDVKPANILRVARGHVLGDLGIVQWSDFSPGFTSAATLTRASIQLGSWFYMAPEQQANPHEVSSASDIYSLGVTWYELLTKNTPQPAQIAAKRFLPPTGHLALNDFISKMLSYDAVDRPTVHDVRSFIKSGF